LNSNIKILTGTFLKLDFRDKKNSGKKKLFGIIISYLFANTILSLNNYLTFGKESFVVLSLSTGAFLFVFIILNDFGNLFFNKKHNDIINTLPINNSELVYSKLLSAILYLGLYSLVLVLPQVVFFYLYESSIYEITSFIISGIFSLFFISGIILFVYSFSLRLFSRKSNFILYFLQFVFFSYVIFVSSLASHYSLNKIDIFSFVYVKYFPQFYFVLAINNISILVGLVLLTIFLYVLFFYYLKKNYTKISSIIYSYPDIKKEKHRKLSLTIKYNKFICRSFIKNNEEKASYKLTLNQLKNSKSLKLKFIPLSFLPMIICIIAIFTDMPVFKTFSDTQTGILVLTPSISFTFFMCIRLIISATKAEEENSNDIEWIYLSLPVFSLKRLQNANIKFVFANFVFPIILILFLILSIKVSILPLILNLLFILSATFFINTVFLQFDRAYPYSIEASKYNSVSKFGEILFITLIGIAIFVAQIFIFENVIFVIISVLSFFVISIVLRQRQFTLKSIFK
jgi:hypothetical protein